MGDADYLRLGDWNILCDRCGRKMKGSEAVQNWQGFWMHSYHWEARQPQDFVRTIVEHPTPPFVRNPADNFVLFPDGITTEDSPTPFAPGEDEPIFLLTESGITILTETGTIDVGLTFDGEIFADGFYAATGVYPRG